MQTTKVKNGTIVLPKELQKPWQNANVFIRGFEDKIVIEKSNNELFDKETEKKLQMLGKKITQKDIEKAVKWARGR